MDKIKFDIDYFKNNKVAINCKSMEEIEELHKLLLKNGIKIEHINSVQCNFNKYGENICYEYDYGVMWYGSEDFYKNENYEILDFTGFSDTQFCNKTTILSEDIELKNGDIIKMDYGDIGKLMGIITPHGIYYTNGTFDLLDEIDVKLLMWYIPNDVIIKNELSHLVSKLLFNGILDKKLEELIIYIPCQTETIRTKIYHVSRNKYSLSYTDKYISDEVLNPKDMCCIETGLLKGKYGRIIAIKEEELTEEEISQYDKISSIVNYMNG